MVLFSFKLRKYHPLTFLKNKKQQKRQILYLFTSLLLSLAYKKSIVFIINYQIPFLNKDRT